MPNTKLLQIVPRLPPYSDGVGDYARLLALQLFKSHQLETEFVSFRPGKTPGTTDGFKTHRLFEHTARELRSFVSPETTGILLHYSNYPYLQGKLDAPIWLAQALKQIKRDRNLPVAVMFHELPTLKWKQTRILNPIQTRVSRRLARLATTVYTDSHHFKTHLAKWTSAPLTCMPDFSTIGEPEPKRVRPLSDRPRRLIIFGGSDRRRVYDYHFERLLATCHSLGIKEVCDIGTPQNISAERFGAIAFKEMGFQPAETVCDLLLTSVAGLMDYSRFPGDLGKSSVFAAFCAHGLIPICTTYNPSEADGLFPQQHYAIAQADLQQLSAQAQQAIANNARSWYSDHCLSRNAERFATCFSSRC